MSAVRVTAHACRMLPDHYLPDLLQDGLSPDQDLLDLIEQSYLEGQIDGETLTLAFAWLAQNRFVALSLG